MKLSRTAGYALQATLQLAEANSSAPVPCSQLAAKGQMPERFLLQILRSLVTHGILHSARGVDGGYRLERKPEEISLLDLIEAVDGPLHACVPAADGLPEQSRTKLCTSLEQITASARRQLAEIKVSSLLSTNHRGVEAAIEAPVA
jgi:Rrf2 family protein